jgi:hypothetical protein
MFLAGSIHRWSLLGRLDRSRGTSEEKGDPDGRVLGRDRVRSRRRPAELVPGELVWAGIFNGIESPLARVWIRNGSDRQF